MGWSEDRSTITRQRYDELPELLRAALEPRVKRLGYLGEFFQCTAHQPDALLAFIHLTEALRAALPDRLTEVVALTVGAVSRNRYERHQHERLCETLGVGRDWVADVLALDPARLAGDEAAVQRLVLALLGDHGHGARPELAAVTGTVGEATAVAVLLLVGRYQAHAVVVNALELEPPVPSIFAGGQADG